MNLYYINHNGAKINLTEWPYMIQKPETLLAYEWDYESTEKHSSGGVITNLRQPIKEAEITISVYAEPMEDMPALLRNMTDIFDTDITNMEPGRLYWNDSYLRCYIYGSDYQEYEEDMGATDRHFRVVAENPFWITEKTYGFYAAEIEEADGLNYPFNYPFNFAAGEAGSSILYVDHYKESPFRMRILGPAANPLIHIGDNYYGCDVTLSDGDYLEINTTGKRAEVIKHLQNGTKVDCFANRRKTTSTFEPIQPGQSIVTWPGTFGWELMVQIERSEPL